MLSAANHGVGTANPANKSFERRSKKFKYAPHLHKRGCPVGMVRRTAEFMLGGTDTQLKAWGNA
jgi:hypothetical protein